MTRRQLQTEKFSTHTHTDDTIQRYANKRKNFDEMGNTQYVI